jgi:phosphoribosylformylglycinamidine synthase I
MDAIARHAVQGGLVLGVCNGFQILCEAGLLPGVLRPNVSLDFICADVAVRVARTDTAFTYGCRAGEVLSVPIKHGEGCYVADETTLAEIEDQGQVVFRYADRSGRVSPEANPNGSLNNIAGVCNAERNVVGLMPHPEHAAERLLGGDDGLKLFRSVQAWWAADRGRHRPEPPDVRDLAHELERAIRQQRARQKTGLAQDLEAVADADHDTAAPRVLGDRVHDRRHPRDRAAAKIVAIREPAGQHDRVAGPHVAVLVPERHRLVAQDALRHAQVVPIVVRPRKDDHTPAH